MAEAPLPTERDSQHRTRRLLNAVAVATLGIVTVVLAFKALPILLNDPATAPPLSQDALLLAEVDVNAEPAVDGAAGSAMSLLNTPTDAAGLVLLREGDRPLDDEPANLPTFAGGQRVLGFSRSQVGVVEQHAVWQLPSTVAVAAGFYRDAAVGLGFQPLTQPADEPGAQVDKAMEVFIRPAPGGAGSGGHEVLVVRVTPLARQDDAGPHVRTVLWLRSPAAGP